MIVEYQALYHIDKITERSRFQYPSTNQKLFASPFTYPEYSRPTLESRKELFGAAKRKAEEVRVQIRKHHSVSLKRGKYEKHSVELEEVLHLAFYNNNVPVTLVFSSRNLQTSTSRTSTTYSPTCKKRQVQNDHL